MSTKPVSVRSVPPYDTGRVRIGVAYIQRYRWNPDVDDEFVQSALLGRGSRFGGISRVVSWLPQVLLWAAVGVVFLFLLSLGVSR